jgi:hypothetical protein
MSNKRNDGKIGVSFRIPIELDKAFNRHCVWRDDKISKSDLISQLIFDYLRQQGVKVVSTEAKPEASDDIFD